MFRSYHLQPITTHGRPIAFEWNPKTGGVRGPSAALVIEMARQARRAGEVVGHPQPTVHLITDPLRHPSELAVVLGNDWQLPQDLADVYPLSEGEREDTLSEIDGNGVENPRKIEPLS